MKCENLKCLFYEVLFYEKYMKCEKYFFVISCEIMFVVWRSYCS